MDGNENKCLKEILNLISRLIFVSNMYNCLFKQKVNKKLIFFIAVEHFPNYSRPSNTLWNHSRNWWERQHHSKCTISIWQGGSHIRSAWTQWILVSRFVAKSLLRTFEIKAASYEQRILTSKLAAKYLVFYHLRDQLNSILS